MRQSIGRENAIDLAATEWWKGKSAYEIVKFQLFTNELCMPLDVFYRSLNEHFKRSVFNIELAGDDLLLEFLGEKDPPTIEEIIAIIPEEKRIIIEK